MTCVVIGLIAASFGACLGALAVALFAYRDKRSTCDTDFDT